MSSDIIIFLGVLGYLVSLWILYAIIRSASDTTTRDRIQRQNRDLLALMAEKLGVDVDMINKIIKREP